MARDDTRASPFLAFDRAPSPRRDAFAPDEGSLVDALFEGRLESLDFVPAAGQSPRPREAGLYDAARTNDRVGVVPSVAPKRWNERWPKTRVPGKRFVAVFDDEPTAKTTNPEAFHARSAENDATDTEPTPEEARAIAKAFRGIDIASRETNQKKNKKKSKNDAAAAGPARTVPIELLEIRTLDRTSFLSREHFLSPYEAKGETASEAFARFARDDERDDAPIQPEEFKVIRERAKAKTLFHLRKIRRLPAETEDA